MSSLLMHAANDTGYDALWDARLGPLFQNMTGRQESSLTGRYYRFHKRYTTSNMKNVLSVETGILISDLQWCEMSRILKCKKRNSFEITGELRLMSCRILKRMRNRSSNFTNKTIEKHQNAIECWDSIMQPPTFPFPF